jgi:NAD(P)-dependent dehydrogenase (short-subunit alcohol dehydrogenase family)
LPRAPLEAVLADAEGGGGPLVNVIGGAARTPDPLFLIGGSVNAAMANFLERTERSRQGATASRHVIHPGTTETDRIRQLFEQRAARADDAEARKSMKRTACAASASRRDVAELALFLCSEQGARHPGVRRSRSGGSTGLF